MTLGENLGAPREPRRRSRNARSIVGFLALLASCGGGTEPQREGSYRATITGSISETAEGPAAFMDGVEGWTLLLMPGEFEDGWSLFLSALGPRPAAGAIIPLRPRDFSTPLSLGEATGDVARSGPADAFEVWMISSGQLRVTMSSSSRLAGTFELSAEPFFEDGPGAIAMTGTFEAILIGDRPFVRFGP